MKIPWFIVILSALLVFGGVLYLGSRNYDFTQKPSTEDLQFVAQAWQDSHPPLPHRDTPLPTDANDTSRENTANSAGSAFSDTARPIEQTSNHGMDVSHHHLLEAEDLITRPALDHFMNRSAEHLSLLKLAKQLDAQGHYEFALLAYERLLDSSIDTEPREILPKITRLREVVKPWNIDPELTRSFTLHCHVPESHYGAITIILESLPELIADSSSFLVLPVVKISSIKQREGYPTPPISMWCSLESHETPRLSFQLKPTDAQTSSNEITPNEIQQKIHFCLYQLVQQTLAHQSQCIVPTDLIAPNTASSAFKSQITRWSWSQFVQILAAQHPEEKKQPHTQSEPPQRPPRAIPVSE